MVVEDCHRRPRLKIAGLMRAQTVAVLHSLNKCLRVSACKPAFLVATTGDKVEKRVDQRHEEEQETVKELMVEAP